jgi:hypothetical protein
MYKIFYRSGLNVSQAIEKVNELGSITEEQKVFLEFIKNSEIGICK